MSMPASLQRRIEPFRSDGRILRDGLEPFVETSRLQVMIGRRMVPRAGHPFAGLRPADEGAGCLDLMRQVIARGVEPMPAQAGFIAAHCRAAPA